MNIPSSKHNKIKMDILTYNTDVRDASTNETANTETIANHRRGELPQQVDNLTDTDGTTSRALQPQQQKRSVVLMTNTHDNPARMATHQTEDHSRCSAQEVGGSRESIGSEGPEACPGSRRGRHRERGKSHLLVVG